MHQSIFLICIHWESIQVKARFQPILVGVKLGELGLEP